MVDPKPKVEKMTSAYSPTESFMIMCMTREKKCSPEDCLKCGWLRDDTKEWLNKEQSKWEGMK